MTSAEPSRAAPYHRVIHLEDARMRVRERGELATEGLTAVTLLDAVQVAYARHAMDAFVVLNAVAAAALAGVVIRGVVRMRRHRDAASTGVNVVGVFGGLTAVVEGIHKLHTAHFTPGRPHFALGTLTVCTGLLTTAIALMMERLEHRRALSITDDGIRMRLNKFRRFDAAWTDIAELRLDAKQARLVSASGRTRAVPLGRLVNRDEVSEALVHAARERGIPVVEQGKGAMMGS